LGLISTLLGTARPFDAAKPPPKRAIKDIEAALRRLADERSNARAAVAAALAQRDALLLVDGSDEKIVTLDALNDQHRLMLERCERAEGIPIAELEGARGANKRTAWKGFVDKWNAAETDFLAKYREALAAHEALGRLRAEASAAGFVTEAQLTFPQVPNILTHALLEQYAQRRDLRLDRQLDAARQRPAPPAPAAAAPVLGTIPRKAPAPLPPPPPSPPARRETPRRVTEPVGDDEVVVEAKRDQLPVETPNGRVILLRGDQAEVPRKLAEILMRNGAADRVASEPGAEAADAVDAAPNEMEAAK
jgi:hypothetical protein